jgi:hypothetical protein
LMLAGQIDEAELTLLRAAPLAERTGDSHNQARALCAQTLTALRQHRAELAASLLPKALAASEAIACPEHAPFAKACEPWLALLKGDEDEVETLAEEAIGRLKATFWNRHFSWVWLWPLIAVRVRKGKTAEAIAAAGHLLAPPLMRMPDEIETAVESSIEAWDEGEHERAHAGLVEAVALAYEHRFL